jgi:hypothetical protein
MSLSEVLKVFILPTASDWQHALAVRYAHIWPSNRGSSLDKAGNIPTICVNSIFSGQDIENKGKNF